MDEVIEKIKKIKKALGNELVILTHHYQRKEIVDLGDYKGDSFALSKKAAENNRAKFIIFCGVHFMAESAAILSQPNQTVQIPNPDAGCWMADMIDVYMVEKSWSILTNYVGNNTILPIVYVNSDAEIKSFCGKNGGTTCTSSNAMHAFDWVLNQGKKIFFLPDQHLGRNTANRMGINPEEIILFNPDNPLDGYSPESIQKAKIFLWNGYCLVHTRFSVDHILKMRAQHPESKLVVHPECTDEVAELADAVGSTSYIVEYVQDAQPGETVIIGTEINLVERLAHEFPDKNIIPLNRSMCPNMFKINPANLLETLNDIGQKNLVTVSEDIKNDAKMALDRMLRLRLPN